MPFVKNSNNNSFKIIIYNKLINKIIKPKSAKMNKLKKFIIQFQTQQTKLLNLKLINAFNINDNF